MYQVYVLTIFIENYVDGTEFVSLTESEVKAMVPPIGLVKKIMRLSSKVCSS